MKRDQSILIGATALTPALAAFAVSASTIYEVDEDGDGRADRLLILEQSDSLAGAEKGCHKAGANDPLS
jgi:hypothetical protein